jgi:hypothetical protein
MSLESCVLVAPVSDWPNMKAEIMPCPYDIGNGSDLSPTGELPATHKGAHMWLSDAQITYFNEHLTGQFNETFHVSETTSGITHYMEVITPLGLQRAYPPFEV